MTSTSLSREVIVGVDTHKDVHVAVALDHDGRVIGHREVKTTESGCIALHQWATRMDPAVRYAVEGTGSYGAGLARYLAQQGNQVTEVRGPSRKVRHDHGKSDRVDAEAAARALFAGTATIVPKAGDAWVEMVRVLRIARTSAMQHRGQVGNQLQAVVVSAPPVVRDQLQGLRKQDLIARAGKFRVQVLSEPVDAVRWTLRSLARRHYALTEEIDALDVELHQLIAANAPQMLAIRGAHTEVAGVLLVVAGDNPERLRSEASFAALCGVSPLPASSGKTNRHRLNRGGDRHGNCALWWIVISRLRNDARTQDYARRRTAEGRSKPEIIRCLKRYVAREVYHALTAT